MMRSQDAVRRVTIADVARHAGVSTAAVSKVLRNAYGVSAEMSQRVRSSMAELGYRPHAAARGMRGRSFTIGLLLDNIRNPFYGDFLDGVTDALAKTDFQVLVGSAGFAAQSQSRLADAMIDRAMDGLILVAPSMSRPQVIAVGKTIPAVVVGHHDTADEYDSVVDDDLAGAALVVDHLVALGHRRIAHTSATIKAGQWTQAVPSTSAARATGRPCTGTASPTPWPSPARATPRRAATRPGASCSTGPTGPRPFSRAPTSRPWASCGRPYELGLRIPADLSLVGYDNTTLAASAPINLTSVDQAAHDLGSTAARLLGERMDGRSRSVLTSTAPRLIVRNTTAPPPS